MPADFSFTHQSRRQFLAKWATRALVVYWIALFIATHVTIPGPVTEVTPNDKLMHLMAYGGLGFLCAMVCVFKSRLTLRAALLIFGIILAYGVADELLQILVNREASVLDWVADGIGAVGGIGIVVGLSQWLVPPSTDIS